MPRIAKADVNKALSLAAKNIIDAGGADGRTSRAELKAKLNELPKQQRALTDIFFRFIDNRDFKAGAQVTSKDVTRAVAYAKEHMVAKYDLNGDGLSKNEIAKMSLTGKRAVELAKALKGAVVDPGGATLNSSKLGAEIAKYSKDASYMSESDYNPEFFAQPFPAGHDLTGHNVMTALNAPLSKFFEAQNGDLSAFTFEQYSAKDTKAFIKDLLVAQDSDPFSVKSAKAFGEITKLLGDNLTDVKVFKIGPKDGNKLGQDMGLYAQVIVGRSADGKIAGVMIGNVQT